MPTVQWVLDAPADRSRLPTRVSCLSGESLTKLPSSWTRFSFERLFLGEQFEDWTVFSEHWQWWLVLAFWRPKLIRMAKKCNSRKTLGLQTWWRNKHQKETSTQSLKALSRTTPDQGPWSPTRLNLLLVQRVCVSCARSYEREMPTSYLVCEAHSQKLLRSPWSPKF